MNKSSASFQPLHFAHKRPEEMVDQSARFYDQMRTRRTVRHFSQRPIPMEAVENALRAAGTAPSGANRQPWHFVVITEPDLKAQIRTAAEREEQAFYGGRAPDEWLDALAPLGTDEHKPFLEEAPCLIAIFLKRYGTDEDGARQKNYYVMESVGIATGLLIASLHLSGLATLTHTPSPMQFLHALLERPEEERPYLLLVVGYPQDDAQVPQISRRGMEEFTQFRWGITRPSDATGPRE